MALELSIVTPAGPVLDSSAEWVVVPGAEGEFGVLEGHESFLAPVQPGVVRHDGGSGRVAVSSGFAEVSAGRVTILVRSAVCSDQVDRDAAQAELEHAREALRYATQETSDVELERLRDALATAQAQLRASE